VLIGTQALAQSISKVSVKMACCYMFLNILSQFSWPWQQETHCTWK